MSIYNKSSKELFKQSIERQGYSLRGAASLIDTEHSTLSRDINGVRLPTFRMLLRWSVATRTPLTQLGINVDNDQFPVEQMSEALRVRIMQDWTLLLPKHLYHAGYKQCVEELAREHTRSEIATKLGYQSRGSLSKHYTPNFSQKPNELAALTLCAVYKKPAWAIGFNVYAEHEEARVHERHELLATRFSRDWPGFLG